MATIWRYPAPALKKSAIDDSYERQTIPGTSRKYKRGRHGGIDIAGKEGTPLVAVWPGTVRLKSFGKAYGIQLTVVTGEGEGAFYAHLASLTVSEGQVVKAGQTVGAIGKTGQATGAHLHFEHRKVWNDWLSTINPYSELEAVRAKELAAKPPPPSKADPTTTAIMGKAVADAKALEAWFASKKKQPKLNGTSLAALCRSYIEEGAAEGVRGDIAFAQACKETGYFTYGGDVKPEQHNYCGLGATGNKAGGASFPDSRTGVRAHVQHLRAYGDASATKQKLANPCVDPRFDAVSPKGKSKRWVDLNGKWAVPGKGYGEDILALFEEIGRHIKP